ncbi:Cytoplasmic tRNA 2-thiolation protein 2 [Coemansia sp. RSA 2704]|nr:Cytoplasmic tRNA 2-thiolation protein 2 [Coemansia sp. RSA 2704]
MCVKCKAAKPSVTIRRILYCKQCFVRASVVKFRAAIAKSRKRVDWPRTKVLVAFSGGAASTALLKLTADLQRMERKGTDAEPPFTAAVVGHIDESCLFPGDQENVIRAIAAETDLDYNSLALEDAFAPEEGRAALLELVQASMAPGTVRDQIYARLVQPALASGSHADQLKALFAGLESATDREDMLDIIKTALLLRLARESGCDVVLLGDSATRVAVKAMALTARGRGISLPLETSAESQWFHDLLLLRPMRDFTAKEVVYFNRWTRQRSAHVPTFTTGGPRRASIGRLAEAFIVELDQDFSSTVPTVCRTLQKLEPRTEALAAAACILCGFPAEEDANVWRRRLTVSGAQDVQQAPASIESNTRDLTARLCYSCQNLLHNAAPGTILPRICTQYNDPKAALDHRDELRAKVEEFFISDNDEL